MSASLLNQTFHIRGAGNEKSVMPIIDNPTNHINEEKEQIRDELNEMLAMEGHDTRMREREAEPFALQLNAHVATNEPIPFLETGIRIKKLNLSMRHITDNDINNWINDIHAAHKNDIQFSESLADEMHVIDRLSHYYNVDHTFDDFTPHYKYKNGQRLISYIAHTTYGGGDRNIRYLVPFLNVRTGLIDSYDLGSRYIEGLGVF